jgi:hypothetical protein
MATEPSTDPPFDSSGLIFAFGAAFFGAAATSIAIVIEDMHEKTASNLLEPSIVAIGLAAALFAFFASWIAYHWTRDYEPILFRVLSLTLLVPFLVLIALAPIGCLGGFAVAGVLVMLGFLKLGLPLVLATFLWSGIFLYLQRKPTDSRQNPESK